MIDFDGLIDQYLHREHYPKKEGKYYPSEIGSCLRKVWFSYKEPKKTEKGLIKVFHVGNILHEFITDVLRSEKTPEIELVDSEIPFKMDMDGFTISGRVDDLMLIRVNGKMVLLEVKSTKMLSEKLTEPQFSHRIQLQLYMHSMEVPNGLVLYVEKSTLKTRSFEVRYDKDEALEAIERFRTLHDCLTKNSMPEPEAKNSAKMGWLCDYCEYKEKC